MTEFFTWYLVIQLITIATLPLSLQFFTHLPDRGYTLTKSFGILLVGFVLWIGTSYGLLHNDTGGAWLSVVLVVCISLFLGRNVWMSWIRPRTQTTSSKKKQSKSKKQKPAPATTSGVPILYIILTELIFVAAFGFWAWVRIHDPAANHTEQPMDLMFMNSIRASSTYPPQDAWLSGYAISYYYFGYWILITLARLAGQTTEVAYNVGQACWYGLLLLGCFGIGYNLTAYSTDKAGKRISGAGILCGIFAAIAVGMAGNLQGIMEWLYANGYDVERLATWFGVYNFPQSANVTNEWFIDRGWWWWRSSRVIEDLSLTGHHIEVIDEFPMFSYLLGDNHPHVIAMPFAILLIGMAQNLVYSRNAYGDTKVTGLIAKIRQVSPLGLTGLLLTAIAIGSMIFLNTWDFPPYWLLVTVGFGAVLLATGTHNEENTGLPWSTALIGTIVLGAVFLVGTVIIYLPYFLTAQSQAGGIIPNLFYPTLFPQFIVMFGPMLLAVIALLIIAWHRQTTSVSPVTLSVSFILTYGLPVIFLFVSTYMALNTDAGSDVLRGVALPEGATGHGEFITARWTDINRLMTFVTIGALLSFTLALVWHMLTDVESGDNNNLLFSLLMVAIGLGLIYAPEFVYLRDNFGTRMNTIFKFYYQGWLLLGISSAYAIVTALIPTRNSNIQKGVLLNLSPVLGGLSILLILGGLIYPFAGVYAKTNGFSSTNRTFDSVAYIGTGSSEYQAIQWVRENTAPDAVIVEGKGASYRAEYSRISAITGRPTLLGWDGHESQWRGRAYGEMAMGRPEALQTIYTSNRPDEIVAELQKWDVDYVYIGPTERSQYGILPTHDLVLMRVMDVVFEHGDVRVYRSREY
ncbi:MAG: DUF2298 domain-containing protein [Chloroflexota bacterium]